MPSGGEDPEERGDEGFHVKRAELEGPVGCPGGRVKFAAAQSVVPRPAAAPASWLEMDNVRPHPRPAESEPGFYQDS